ncbi:MAG: hypothetical protein FWF18_05765 [Dehalococcoidia bacterium]|nr:hypothetical protein [Dehalococcoidia bacterium]
MTKSILEGVQRPKDLVAGRRNHSPPLQMLWSSPSWRERSDRRIWWRGDVTIRHPTGCFVTRRLVPPAWIFTCLRARSPFLSKGEVFRVSHG